jgi:ribonuclease R
MLPEVLSNQACSLRPGEDKLAVTVEVVMNGADVVSVAFHRSLVRSDRRLTYGEVDELFAGRTRAEEPWGEPLALAREVAAALHERRDSLEVGSFEPTLEFDLDGHVTGVRYEQQTESHRVIEMLMILANEQVAGYLADKRLPTLYRVHERPDPQSVTFLVEQLASLDIPTPPLPKQMSPQQAADAVTEISRIVARESGGKRAYGVLVLRALKQAYYSPRNVGHAGLGSARYCHRGSGSTGRPRRRTSWTRRACSARRTSARRCRSSAARTTCASRSCWSACWPSSAATSRRASRARSWA